MKKILPILIVVLGIFALEVFFTNDNIHESAKEVEEPNMAQPQARLPAPGTPVVITKKTLITTDSPQIEEKINTFFAQIPRTNELRNLSDAEVHELPEAVRISGEYLAEMREFFSVHPQPATVELNFYTKCAGEKDLFDSVRAICAARVSQKYTELTGRRVSSKLFDARIASLKEHIIL